MTLALVSFFSWFFIDSWEETSSNQFTLAAPAAGIYAIYAEFSNPSHQFTARLNWGQHLSGSNNNKSEIFLAFEYIEESTEALVADTIYIRAGETGSDDPIRIRSYSGGDLFSRQGEDIGFSSFGSPFDYQIIVSKDSTLNTLQLHISDPELNFTIPLYTLPLSSHEFQLKTIGITAKCTSSNTENFSFGIDSYSTQFSPAPPLQINTHSLSNNACLNLTLNQRLTSAIDAKWSDTNEVINELSPECFFNKVSLLLPIQHLRPGCPKNLRVSTSTMDTIISVALTANLDVNFRDIVFSEIMADATPSISTIPEDEYIEIYNCTSSVIDVEGWLLYDNNTPYNIIHNWDGLLYPDSTFIIVKTQTMWADSFGNISYCSNWSGLNDNGELLKLVQPSGYTVDILDYEKSWWLENSLNTQPGRSLTKLHPRSCNIASNWHPSSLPTGNSINFYSSLPPSPPSQQIIDPHKLGPSQICLAFNPPIDPTSPLKIRASSDLWSNAVFNGQDWTVELQATDYETLFIEIDSARSCSNSSILPPVLQAWHVIPPASSSSIVISEICHTPIDGGSEWIKLSKTSPNPIDIYDLHVNETLVINATNILFESNETITVDNKGSESWMSLSSTTGTVNLTKGLDTLETVNYSKCWHSSPDLYNSGSTLRRVSLFGESNDPRNWISGTGPWGNQVDSSNSVELGVIWSIYDGKLKCKSHAPMDSSILDPQGWSFPTSWKFTDLSKTSALSTESLEWITLWTDSVYYLENPQQFKIKGLKSILNESNNSVLKFNEILSEPNEGSCRFIEIKNTSETTALSNNYLITSSDFPEANSWIRLSEESWIIPPGEVMAFSECPSWIENTNINSHCVELDIPSLQKGRTLQIAQAYGHTIDHYTIPDCSEGVSKERICSNSNIWADSPSEGPTPGLDNINNCNSSPENIQEYFNIWPKTLKRSSLDYRWVNIQSTKMLNSEVHIYTLKGEMVNAFTFEGDFRAIWEGLDDDGKALIAGNYLIILSGINDKGKAIQERELVVILE